MKRIIVSVMVILLAFSLTPIAAQQGKTYYVDVRVANVRAEATSTAKLVIALVRGKPAFILEIVTGEKLSGVDTWYKVTASGKEGYVLSSLLTDRVPIVASNSRLPTPQPAGGTTLSLPTVNVFAGITTFPLDGYSWAIDPWEKRVGHLQGTAWFDSNGNVVLGGHSTYPNGKPGIFAGLYQLNIGDPVIVNVDGGEHHYVVTDKLTVHYDDLTVAYPSSDSKLTLITCDIPSYDAKTQFYSQRLVVIARPG